MTQNAVNINILSNVREAVRGVDDVSDAVDEVSDRLHDMSKEGSSSTDRMEKDFRDLAKTADREADQIKDKFRTAYKSVRESSDDATDASRKGFSRAADASKEFSSEAISNVSEFSSSFDGSMESVGDLVQGTLGGLTQGLGPAFGLAAAAAATAAGVIVDSFVSAQEATDEAKASAYEYGLTVAELGRFADASSRINELTGSIEGLKNVQDIATISGWQQADVLAALATGDGLAALTAAYNDGANATTIATNRALELQGVLDGTAQGFTLAADGAALQSAALYELAAAAGTTTGQVDDLGNSIVTMPDGKEVVINADTKTAHENVQQFEDRVAGMETIKDVRVRVRVEDQTKADMDSIIHKINQRRGAVGVGARQITGG